MVRRLRPRPQALVAAGLVGMALYAVAARAGHPALLASDAVHGAWVGACIGLELLGVGLLRTPRAGRGRGGAGT